MSTAINQPSRSPVAGFAPCLRPARGLSSLLYGVKPYDWMTFAGTVLVIGGGAILTTCLAAARARHIDPLVVLRYE